MAERVLAGMRADPESRDGVDVKDFLEMWGFVSTLYDWGWNLVYMEEESWDLYMTVPFAKPVDVLIVTTAVELVDELRRRIEVHERGGNHD